MLLRGDAGMFLNFLCKDNDVGAGSKGNTKIFSIYRNADYCGSVELQILESVTPEIGNELLECEWNKGLAPIVIQQRKLYIDKLLPKRIKTE